MSDFERFTIVASQVIAQSPYRWYTAPADELAEGVVMGSGNIAPSENGVKALIKVLGAPARIIDAGISQSTAMAIINDLLPKIDMPLYARVNSDTGHVDDFVVSPVEPVSPVMAMATMLELQANGKIPGVDDLLVESMSMNGSLSMRVVAPNEWNFVVGDNDPYYGSAIIDVSGGGLSIAAGVQRLACTNYQIGDYVAKIKQYGSSDNLKRTIETSFRDVWQVAGAMKRPLDDMVSVNVAYPSAMLEQVIKSLAMSGKAADSARHYFAVNTGQRTMYDILQAITHGTKVYTAGRRHNSQKRIGSEQMVWDIMSGIVTTVAAGGATVEEYYLDGPTIVRDKIAGLLRSRARDYDGEPGEVLLSTANEVSTIDVGGLS